MIDLHAHVLPGLDDGPALLEESLRIISQAARHGITAIAATPHVSPRYPTSSAAMRAALADVRRAVDDAGIPVSVLPGGEVALETLRELSIEEIRSFGLGGNPRYVLVEFPYDAWPPSLALELTRLHDAGIRVVLAHPERNADVQARPGRLEGLVAAGALVQVTAGALQGRESGARRTARALFEFGLVHMLASDAHDVGRRGPSLAAAVGALRDDALGRWLSLDVPHALVADLPLPERPARRRRFPAPLRLRR